MKHDPIFQYTSQVPAPYGMAFIPRPYDNPDADLIYSSAYYHPMQEVSDIELEKMDELTLPFKNIPNSNIMEIGVSRNGERSFTQVLLRNKHPQSKYIGVDIDDKSYLDNHANGIYTIKVSSSDQFAIRTGMREWNINGLSILFIDGHHSFNMVMNDWSYSDMIGRGGIVIFHDTNVHPGPKLLLEGIDTSLFTVERYFEDNPDVWGMGSAKRL